MAGSFHIEHFGCRAARADGEAVGDRLRAAGLILEQPSQAEVVVVNTCSVTAEADRAARVFIRRAHRLNPAAHIVVTGCYAQRAPTELAAMSGVSAIVGNSHKALAPQIVLDLITNRTASTLSPLVQIQAAPPPLVEVDNSFAHSFFEEFQWAPKAQSGPPQVAQTRPNLKIQEGCGNRCTFCVIPLTRGPSRSLPPDAVLKQIEGFVAVGGNELVLSGINLGRWGRDLPAAPGAPGTLAELVRRIFDSTALPRLRLSSIEPMDWSEDLIGLLARYGGSRLARHVHLPLQSGSDAVLRRMHRRYRPWHYAAKVEALLRAAGPDLTLGADVMVGFPGETDAEFEETAAFLRALPFGYLHLFPFSARPGTPGWELHRQKPVPAAAAQERMAALRALAAEQSLAHRSRFVGRELDALTLHSPEAARAQGWTSALSENFLPIEVSGQLPANRLLRLRVTGITQDGCLQAVPGAPAPSPARPAPSQTAAKPPRMR